MNDVINLGIDMESTFDREQALTLEEACKLIVGRGSSPGHKKCLHVDIARRWSKRGCRPAGELGPRLFLPTVRLGGVRYTMPEWVQAFERMRVRIAAQADAAAREPQGRGKREARQAYEEACRVLKAHGV